MEGMEGRNMDSLFAAFGSMSINNQSIPQCGTGLMDARGKKACECENATVFVSGSFE